MGAADRASRELPNAASTAIATTAYTTKAIPNAVGIARRMVRDGSRTSSPNVAIRA